MRAQRDAALKTIGAFLRRPRWLLFIVVFGLSGTLGAAILCNYIPVGAAVAASGHIHHLRRLQDNFIIRAGAWSGIIWALGICRTYPTQPRFERVMVRGLLRAGGCRWCRMRARPDAVSAGAQQRRIFRLKSSMAQIVSRVRQAGWRILLLHYAVELTCGALRDGYHGAILAAGFMLNWLLLWRCAWLVHTILLLWQLQHRLFEIFLTEPLVLPLPDGPLSSHSSGGASTSARCDVSSCTLDVALQASSAPLLQHLAFLELVTVTRWSRAARSRLFRDAQLYAVVHQACIATLQSLMHAGQSAVGDTLIALPKISAPTTPSTVAAATSMAAAMATSSPPAVRRLGLAPSASGLPQGRAVAHATPSQSASDAAGTGARATVRASEGSARSPRQPDAATRGLPAAIGAGRHVAPAVSHLFADSQRAIWAAEGTLLAVAARKEPLMTPRNVRSAIAHGRCVVRGGRLLCRAVLRCRDHRAAAGVPGCNGGLHAPRGATGGARLGRRIGARLDGGVACTAHAAP